MTQPETPTRDTDELLTIPEAAARLGMTERGLRRLLTRPEYAGRTQTRQRATPAGTRTIKVVPPELLADLRRWQKPGPDGETPPRGSAVRGEACSVRAVATSYEAALSAEQGLIAEKDARIADMTARIASLERVMGELFEALRREQTLRALPPPAAPETVPGAVTAREADTAKTTAAEATQTFTVAVAAEPSPDSEPTLGGMGSGQAPPWRKPAPDPERTLYTGIPGGLDISLSSLAGGIAPQQAPPEPGTPGPASGTEEGVAPEWPAPPPPGAPWTALLDRLARWVGD